MANAQITRVRIDEQALEEAAQRGKGTRAAVNERARAIRDRANSMAGGFKTARFYDRKDKQLRGGSLAAYLYKPANGGNHPVALVYTGNYAAMRFEHDNNALLKASR